MRSWPQKESAPGPDGIPHSLHRCAGGLGSTFLFNVYQHVLAGGLVPVQFAASRTVFIPKSSDVDNNVFIVRSPNALRPLTLCNCHCKILTTALSLAHHEMRTSVSEMHLVQTTFSRSKRLPWRTWRALLKNQAFF